MVATDAGIRSNAGGVAENRYFVFYNRSDKQPQKWKYGNQSQMRGYTPDYDSLVYSSGALDFIIDYSDGINPTATITNTVAASTAYDWDAAETQVVDVKGIDLDTEYTASNPDTTIKRNKTVVKVSFGASEIVSARYYGLYRAQNNDQAYSGGSWQLTGRYTDPSTPASDWVPFAENRTCSAYFMKTLAENLNKAAYESKDVWSTTV